MCEGLKSKRWEIILWGLVMRLIKDEPGLPQAKTLLAGWLKGKQPH